MDWFKSYNGASIDPKFQLIAHKAKLKVHQVALAWWVLMDSASQSKNRGDVSSFDFEAMDFFFQFEDGIFEKAFNAFVEKGMIIDGKIKNWSERQKNEAAERQKKYRENKRLQEEAVTTDDNSDVTLRNEHNALPEEKRREKREEKERKKEDIKNNTKKSSNGTRLPDDWQPPQEFKDFCEDKYPNVDTMGELQSFKDYWIGVPGQKGRKANWLATWRNWLKRSISPALKNGNQQPSKMNAQDMFEDTAAFAKQLDEERFGK